MNKLEEFEKIASGTLMAMGLMPGLVDQTVTDIKHYYSLGKRKYHGIEHVLYMFEQGEEVRWLEKATEPDSFLAMAILFHDIHWFPTAEPRESEIVSANMCHKVMEYCGTNHRPAYDNYMQRPAVDVIYEAIVDTSNYMKGVTRSQLGERLMDLDLCSLAKPWDDFKSDCSKSIAEFGGKFIDRALFLAEFHRSREGVLFLTDQGREEWNADACANIRRLCREQEVGL